ncbi:MAG: hypothetical protein ACI9EF_002027 [Pseudohongiellaceae bacterium]|jgi:hypothetical protein
MTPRNRSFAVGATLSTLVIPALLIAVSPFGAARPELGVVSGWGMALLVIVPSFVAMSRVMVSGDNQRIQTRFLFSMMARFVASVMGAALFATTVDEPPLLDFILAFFLGFAVLSACELTFLLSKSPDGNHA